MSIRDQILKEAEKEEQLSRLLFEDRWTEWSAPINMRNWLIAEYFKCIYCGSAFIKNEQLIPIHLDHMDPQNLGGGSQLGNMIACCVRCNLRKGSMVFTDWLQKIPIDRRDECLDVYIYKHGHHPKDAKLTSEIVNQLKLGD